MDSNHLLFKRAVWGDSKPKRSAFQGTKGPIRHIEPNHATITPRAPCDCLLRLIKWLSIMKRTALHCSHFSHHFLLRAEIPERQSIDTVQNAHDSSFQSCPLLPSESAIPWPLAGFCSLLLRSLPLVALDTLQL